MIFGLFILFVRIGQSGTTALHIAAEEGHSSVLSYLISQGASVEGGNVSGSSGNAVINWIRTLPDIVFAEPLHAIVHRNELLPQRQYISFDLTKSERQRDENGTIYLRHIVYTIIVHFRRIFPSFVA